MPYFIKPYIYTESDTEIEPRPIAVKGPAEGESVDVYMRNYSQTYSKVFEYKEYVAFFLEDGTLTCVNPHKIEQISFKLVHEEE